MFVTEVIPLRRGIGVETLSYFSSEHYPIGTLITIPVRSQQILGLVSQVHEVSAAKTALRAATFSLRKLPPQTNPQSLTPAYIRTAEALSTQYACQTGSVLFSLLPPEIQRGDIPLPHTKVVETTHAHPPEILQAQKRERFAQYRLLVREHFAHGSSVLIVAPTSIEVLELKEALTRGIEDRVIVLATSLSKRDLIRAYASLEDFSHAQLIITTPSHALIERHDIALTILEESRSPHYKERMRPYLDYRDVLRIHASFTGRRFIMADLLPRTEEEYARREDTYLTYGQTPKRLELPGTLTIVERPEAGERTTPYTLFMPEMTEVISRVKREKSHLFIFSARRGLAPVVTCQDCGHIFRSPESGAPYSLLRTYKQGVEERWFVCGTSGERIRALDTCTVCGSWKLKERGIGIQFVHDELKKIVPDTPIILFDHTTATTFKKATFLKNTFYDTKGAIMVGTYMALPYLTKDIDTSLVVSLDALLTTPTWRLEEENLALLLRLREITKGSVYLQSKTREHDLFSYARHAEVERFYTEEIELRKAFHYPPFSRFIHLTWQGSPEEAKLLERHVLSTLEPFSVATYQSPLAPKGSIVYHGLVRTDTHTWPHEALIHALRGLPPTIRIVHDPDRIV